MKFKSLKRCEYGVYDPFSDDLISPCGEGSTEFIWWGDKKDGMYVCEKHYEKIIRDEEKDEIENG